VNFRQLTNKTINQLLLGFKSKEEPRLTKMTYCRAVVLVAFNFVIFRSEAFNVPTRKATVIGNHPPLIFAQNGKSVTPFNEKRISQLDEKLPNQRYDAPPSSSLLQREIETALAPVSDFLDNVSGGWALSYADLSPNRYVFVT
jgi:hypothetical protein